MGKALAGGSGWVLLSWSDRRGRLVNQRAADHAHVLADSRSQLALDRDEHAYHLDFGAKASAYVGALDRPCRLYAKVPKLLCSYGRPAL